MNLNQLTNYTWNNNIPFSVLLELTYNCNLDCSFCYNDVDLKGEVLTVDHYRKLFKDLVELGTMHLTLSGGEPLASPDFFQIGKAAREFGFAVRIKSNGHALNKRMVSRIQQEIDPFGFDISLHGACAETHDRQTRIPGSYEKLLRNMTNLSERGLRFQINVPVTVWNENELKEICEIADRFQVPIGFGSDIFPKDNGDRTPLDLVPSAEGHLEMFKVIKTHNQSSSVYKTSTKSNNLQDTNLNKIKSFEGVGEKDSKMNDKGQVNVQKKQCGAGSSTVTIDPFGTVYPCVQWRQAVGNLHKQSMIEIWRDSVELGVIRKTLEEVKRLNEKQEHSSVGFCAARARQETGSPTKKYPLVLLLSELKQRSEELT